VTVVGVVEVGMHAGWRGTEGVVDGLWALTGGILVHTVDNNRQCEFTSRTALV